MTPSEALSIIVDGMDQAKTNLPHFRGWCKPKVLKKVSQSHKLFSFSIIMSMKQVKVHL